MLEVTKCQILFEWVYYKIFFYYEYNFLQEKFIVKYLLFELIAKSKLSAYVKRYIFSCVVYFISAYIKCVKCDVT